MILLGAAGALGGRVGEASAASPLCASSAEDQSYEWVTRVQVATGTSNTGPSPYYDGSGVVLANLQAGQTYPVEVDVATDGTPYEEYVKIWFDLNQNGVIEDPEELVFDENQVVTELGTFSGTITVPPTAFNGQIYARVIMQFSGSPNLCGSYTFGETEDYLFAVTGGVPNPDNHTLSITTSGDGSVSSTPLGLDCPGVCSFDFEQDAIVALTATPADGSTFAGWSGDCSGADPNVQVTMAAAKSCTATFSGATVDVCGDGATTAGEQCDGNGESADCDADCTFASCGDGTINAAAGEECDDAGESSTCDANCTAVSCGDGTANASAGEQCDGAGSSSECNGDCTLSECGDGLANAEAGEACDDAGESPTCNANCTGAACGDGFVNVTAGESCDDGGESASCNVDCSPAICGDGIINPTAREACDDAGASATCNIDCTSARCGDRIVNEAAGEACDDGNSHGGDGCADCLIEQTGTGGGPGSGGAGSGSGGAGSGGEGPGGEGPGSGGREPGSGGEGPATGAGGEGPATGSGGEGPATGSGGDGPATGSGGQGASLPSVDAATGPGPSGEAPATPNEGGGSGDSEDDESSEAIRCSCSVPGARSSLPQGGLAALGLAVSAVVGRRMRRRVER